jgi:Rieske Fe-S protein
VTNEKMPDETADASRRALMGGFLGLGVAVPILAACGSDDAESAADDKSASDTETDDAAETDADSGAATPAGGIATKSEVPVGGGKIIKAEKVVVTQPTAGDFKAFSAMCTHQGCLVATIKGTNINCACHGSQFSITDGSVVKGPATKPLEELTVTVTGEDLAVT